MQEGFELMVAGMSVVFAFLVLLVVCMTVTGKVISSWFPIEEIAPTAEPVATTGSRVSEAMVVALAAARREQIKRG